MSTYEDIHSEEREMQLQIRQQERFLNKSRQLAAKYIQKIEQLPGTPSQFAYFQQILRQIFVENEPVTYQQEEVFIGTYCVMMPQELIYAAGARPLKLCSGNYVGFQFGDDVTPRDACPLVKSVIGNNMIGNNSIYNACKMFIVPITCDCKKKMAGMLNTYKETYSLHVPINKLEDEAIAAYIKEVKRMVVRIEEKTGKKVTRKRLKDQMNQMFLVQREIHRFIELKGNERLLIRGTHAMAVLNTFAYDDLTHWGKQLKLLNDELELRLQNESYLTNKKLPRILITGSPITFPNLKLPLLIEEMGGVVTADETCIGDRGLYDPAVICEDSLEGYYRALANRYVAACSCPIFSDNSQRIQRIEQMISDHKVDGIIYHVLRGCLVYDYEYQKMEQLFTEKGIPIIRVESDYNEEDVEQLRIRIEAFIEMIKFKK